MSSIKLKPFKIGIDTWPLTCNGPTFNSYGREIYHIAIGKRINEDLGVEEYIVEEIYKDVLVNMFVEKMGYRVHMNLGCVPQLLITKGNDIIPHNGNIKEYISHLNKSLDIFSEDIMTNIFLEMQSTYDKSKKGPLETFLKDELANMGVRYAKDLLYFVLYERMQNKIDQANENKDMYQECSIEKLQELAFSHMLKEDSNVDIENLKNELLYRLIKDKLREKGGEN